MGIQAQENFLRQVFGLILALQNPEEVPVQGIPKELKNLGDPLPKG
jgi:hypothetical protein